MDLLFTGPTSQLQSSSIGWKQNLKHVLLSRLFFLSFYLIAKLLRLWILLQSIKQEPKSRLKNRAPAITAIRSFTCNVVRVKVPKAMAENAEKLQVIHFGRSKITSITFHPRVSILAVGIVCFFFLDTHRIIITNSTLFK